MLKNAKKGHLKAFFEILHQDQKFLLLLFENYEFQLNCLKVLKISRKSEWLGVTHSFFCLALPL